MVKKVVKVGFVFAITILLAYYGYPFLMGESSSAKARYYLLLDDLSGLAMSSPIRVNGYKVGRVESIRLLKAADYKVLLSLLIESDIPIGTKSELSINTDGLLGENFLLLSPSDDGTVYSPGDTLSMVSSSAIDFGDIQREAFSILSEMKLVTQTLDRTLKGVLSVEESVIQVADKTERVIDEVYLMLKDGEQDINQTFSSLSNFSTSLARSSDLIEKMVTSSLSEDFAETAKNLRASSSRIEVLLRRLDSGEGTMGKLLTDELLYHEVHETLDNINILLRHFNETPRDFMSPLGRSSRKIKRRKERDQREVDGG